MARSARLVWLLVSAGVAAAGLLAAATVLMAGQVAAATLVTALSMCAWSLATTRTVPFALVVPIGFELASAAACVFAVLRFRRERRLIRSLPIERIADDGELAELARSAGVELYRAPATRPAAFCFGLARPRVVVTSGLLERLSVEEQAAALWHEAHHARVREPLRCLLARLVTSTFFWLPVLRDLFERYVLVRELDADRLATSATSRAALAGALAKVEAAPALAGTVGFANLAETRGDRLADPRSPLPLLFRRGRVAISLAAVALLGAAFTHPAGVAVSKSVHTKTMVMRTPVLTPAGITWILVPCPS